MVEERETEVEAEEQEEVKEDGFFKKVVKKAKTVLMIFVFFVGVLTITSAITDLKHTINENHKQEMITTEKLIEVLTEKK